MGRVVLLPVLTGLSHTPVVSLGPHECVAVEEASVDCGTLATKFGCSCVEKSRSIRSSGSGAGLASGVRTLICGTLGKSTSEGMLLVVERDVLSRLGVNANLSDSRGSKASQMHI